MTYLLTLSVRQPGPNRLPPQGSVRPNRPYGIHIVRSDQAQSRLTVLLRVPSDARDRARPASRSAISSLLQRSVRRGVRSVESESTEMIAANIAAADLLNELVP